MWLLLLEQVSGYRQSGAQLIYNFFYAFWDLSRQLSQLLWYWQAVHYNYLIIGNGIRTTTSKKSANTPLLVLPLLCCWIQSALEKALDSNAIHVAFNGNWVLWIWVNWLSPSWFVPKTLMSNFIHWVGRDQIVPMKYF